MKTSLTATSAWTEWKQLCALDLCSKETVSALRSFTKLRFERLLNRYYHESSQAPDNPWHLFETHMTVTQTRQGKCYKDWLFARLEHSLDSDVNVLEGGASLIMRDVVREYLRQECAKPRTVSIDKPLGSEFPSFTLLDLLASEHDSIQTICLREYEKLAEKYAKEIVLHLTDREHVALLTKYLGVSLAHPVAVKAAGCKKTALNKTYVQHVHKIAQVVRAEYPDDDPESQLTLALLILQRIKFLNFEQKKTETPRSILFMLQDQEEMKDLNSYEITATAFKTCDR